MTRLDRRGALPGVELARYVCGIVQNSGRHCLSVVASLRTERDGRHFYLRHATEGPGASGWTEWGVDDPEWPAPELATWCARHGALDVIIDADEVDSIRRARKPREITPPL